MRELTDIFKYDPDFEKSEAEYEEIRKEIIGDADDDSDGDEAGGEGGDDEGGEDEEGDDDMGGIPDTGTTAGATKIVDMTEQDMVAFRRNVYLTIQSSLDFQEAAHKLIKNELKPGLENELCHMIVDCCAQQRTYERFYGLLAERFCKLRKEFQAAFEKIAKDRWVNWSVYYRPVLTKLLLQLPRHPPIRHHQTKEHGQTHRTPTRVRRSLVAGARGGQADGDGYHQQWTHLHQGALPGAGGDHVPGQGLRTHCGPVSELWLLVKVTEVRCQLVVDFSTLQTAFEGLFPRDHPKNSRFAINFFSLIGLGGLTLVDPGELASDEWFKTLEYFRIDLREHLNKRLAKERKKQEEAERLKKELSSSSSSESDSSTSSSDSSSDSDTSDSSSSAPSLPSVSPSRRRSHRRGEDRPAGKEVKSEPRDAEEERGDRSRRGRDDTRPARYQSPRRSSPPRREGRREPQEPSRRRDSGEDAEGRHREHHQRRRSRSPSPPRSPPRRNHREERDEKRESGRGRNGRDSDNRRRESRREQEPEGRTRRRDRS